MKNKYLKFLIIIIFVSFLCSYVVANSGYDEYNLGKKTTITNEKMKEFEEAIKENKNIDSIDFFNEEEINYTNKFSEFVYNINDKGNNLVKKGLKKVLKGISKYMLED